MAMNKEDYIKALEAEGVELTGEETLPALKELYKALPKENADEPEDNNEPETPEEEPEKDPVGDEDEKQPQPKAEVKGKKGKFTVLDSNGKPVRVVDTEEEAESLAKVYAGRIVRG